MSPKSLQLIITSRETSQNGSPGEHHTGNRRKELGPAEENSYGHGIIKCSEGLRRCLKNFKGVGFSVVFAAVATRMIVKY